MKPKRPIKVKQAKLELHYCEEKSHTFWNMVNSLDEPHRTSLYALGVALQNLETQVLKNIHDVAPNFVKGDYWFSKK